MHELVFLHSKTCAAQVWDESDAEKAALICELCREALSKMPVGVRRINVAVANRDDWIEAAMSAREQGAPIYNIITNAPAKAFAQPQMDAFFVNEARQINFLKKILQEAQYLMTPETAGVYCALQSHRIARAESTPSILLVLQNPMNNCFGLCEILQCSEAELSRLNQGRKHFMEFT